MTTLTSGPLRCLAERLLGYTEVPMAIRDDTMLNLIGKGRSVKCSERCVANFRRERAPTNGLVTSKCTTTDK
eukprot:6210947-Pleurochrysis_carterae.AAC.1